MRVYLFATRIQINVSSIFLPFSLILSKYLSSKQGVSEAGGEQNIYYSLCMLQVGNEDTEVDACIAAAFWRKYKLDPRSINSLLKY